MSVSLVAPEVVAMFGVAAVVLVIVAVRVRRRLLRPVAVLGAVVLFLLAGAAGVNEYFDYIPTTGALLGRRAADQATATRVQVALSRPQPQPLHRGLVELVDIPPTHSGFQARRAQVYLPPAWFAVPRPALPVVELLHGTPGSPTDWTRAGSADVTADQWAATHGGQAPIVVMADENGGFTRDSECIGPAETYVVDDIRAWAVQTLGARADANGWAIGGSSEGGWCALMIGLRHPDRFSTLLDFGGLDRPTHSGGALRLVGGSRRRLHAYRLASMFARAGAHAPAMWLEVGTADGGTTRAVRRVAAVAQARHLDVHLVLVPHAHHTWRVFRSSLRDAFPWVATRLFATPT